MRLEAPAWLWLILALPLVFGLWRRRRPAGVMYSSFACLPADFAEPWTTRLARYLPIALRLLALALVILALARPVIIWGETTTSASGVDIVLVVDSSSSMSSADLGPKSRLEYARAVIKDFIRKRSGDEIGIVVFSGRAYTQAPLTLDHDLLLGLVDQIQNGVLEDGTAIGMALTTAVNRLRDAKAKSKVIVLLTDGENNRGEIDPLTAAEVARVNGIRVYTVGLGTKEGFRFTDRDPRSGQLFTGVYKLDENLLKSIARITTGSEANYFNATNAAELRRIYDRIDELEKTEIEVKKREEKTELFPAVALAALLIVLLEATLAETIFRRIPA